MFSVNKLIPGARGLAAVLPKRAATVELQCGTGLDAVIRFIERRGLLVA